MFLARRCSRKIAEISGSGTHRTVHFQSNEFSCELSAALWPKREAKLENVRNVRDIKVSVGFQWDFTESK